MIRYLKKKWGITSNTQLAIIFIVFAITGSASAKLAAPVLEFLGVQPLDFVKVPLGSLIYTLLRIMIIFPIYQILLIVVATIFFQFKFFWEFEKKFLSRIGLKFLFEKKNKD
jgi:hypothetical protein